MSVLSAVANGLLTAASTWALVNAASYLDDQANNTALTTSYVESATFTPGAVTIDAIAVKVASRAVSPSGTVSIRLAQAGALVAGTEVTINVSDLNTSNATNNDSTVFGNFSENSWYLFKFAAPVLLVAATLYTVSAKTSSSTQVNLYRDATAGNWSRFLRTTTTQAPVAGDDMVIGAEWTAAATRTTRTVTMNSTAATDYGSANTSHLKAAIAICKDGTLIYQTTAATNYVLRVSGNFIVYTGGTLNIGTVATPMPRDSTAVLEMDCASDGQFGVCIKSGGVATLQGQSRTSGKNITWSKLSANMAAAATSASVVEDTGWKNGDEVAFSPTSQTYNDFDRKTLNADAGASSLAWTGGTTFAHLGTAPTRGEAMLLTRNVKFRSVSATSMTYFNMGVTSSVDCDWMEARYLSTQATGKFGFEVDANSAGGTWSWDNCSFYDFEAIAVIVRNNFGTWNITNCVFFNIANSSFGCIWTENTTTGFTITNSCFAMCAGAGFITFSNSQPSSATVANNVISGSFVNMTFGGVFAANRQIPASWSNNEFHSNRGQPQISGSGGSSGGHVLTQWKIWNTSNVVTGGFYIGDVSDITFDRCEAYGNSGANWVFDFDRYGVVKFLDCVGNGTTSFSTTDNIRFNTTCIVFGRIELSNCLFSVAAGVLIACTNDIQCTASNVLQSFPLYADNCKFSGTNITANLTIAQMTSTGAFNGLCFLRSQRHGQADNDHRRYTPSGLAKSNGSTIHAASGLSEEIQPSSSTVKIKSELFLVPCNAGQAKEVKLWWRKSSAYNGNAPRLVSSRQNSMGVTADVVAATFSGSADTWVQATYTTPAALETGMFKFYIDCDGTAGSVFRDDMTAIAA